VVVSEAWTTIIAAAVGGTFALAGQYLGPITGVRDRQRQRREAQRNYGLELDGKTRVLLQDAEPDSLAFGATRDTVRDLKELNERWRGLNEELRIYGLKHPKREVERAANATSERVDKAFVTVRLYVANQLRQQQPGNQHEPGSEAHTKQIESSVKIRNQAHEAHVAAVEQVDELGTLIQAE